MKRRRRTVRFPVPELSAREALALSYLFDRLDNALWSVYGNAMLRLSQREGVPLLDGGDDDPEQTAVKERGR
jgi:hypothetical protein